jgi:hypothetical protein
LGHWLGGKPFCFFDKLVLVKFHQISSWVQTQWSEGGTPSHPLLMSLTWELCQWLVRSGLLVCCCASKEKKKFHQEEKLKMKNEILFQF